MYNCIALQVKPLLNVARTEDELRQKEEELNKLREKVQRDEASRKEIEEQQTQLMEEKNQLFIQLQRVSLHVQIPKISRDSISPVLMYLSNMHDIVQSTVDIALFCSTGHSVGTRAMCRG